MGKRYADTPSLKLRRAKYADLLITDVKLSGYAGVQMYRLQIFENLYCSSFHSKINFE
jgi:hypothetical protein